MKTYSKIPSPRSNVAATFRFLVVLIGIFPIMLWRQALIPIVWWWVRWMECWLQHQDFHKPCLRVKESQKNSIGLLSVIASLIAGCHLGRKHTGSMHQLGTALILVFIVWLICVNILPTTIFYLLGISHPTAFTCVNMFSAFSNTLVYIYAYYRMYRTINNWLRFKK